MTLLVNEWEHFILVLCSSIYLVDSNMVIDKTDNMIKMDPFNIFKSK